MVHLKKINHDNWMECLALDVHDWQKQFVNPNIFSLAEAYVHSDANREDAEKYYRCIPFAIYCNDKMVGFTLITYEKECDFDDTPGYEIYRLMIAKAYQGKGIGKETIKRIMEYIKTFPYGEAEYINASWHPENKASERLCLGSGFEIVGKDADDGAIRARLSIRRIPER